MTQKIPTSSIPTVNRIQELKFKVLLSPPEDPPLDEAIIYVRKINEQVDGLYIKLKRVVIMTELSLT